MNTKKTTSNYGPSTAVTAIHHPLDDTSLHTDKRHIPTYSAIVMFSVAALLISMSTAEARWYKWVDENGNISYQDQPPPSDYKESTQVLNSQGVTVKRIPSHEEQAKLDEQKRLKAESNQRDEMLIKSFPAETDLTRTRDKRLGHIDGTVTRMHDQLVILNSRLELIDEKINNRKKRSLKPSAAFESDRVTVIRSINSTKALIKSKLKERRQVAAKFDSDLIRYRELGASQNASLSEE